MEVFRCLGEAEGIDREIPMRQADAPHAAAQPGGEFLVAAAQIEDDGDGVVFLDVRQNEIQEERLPRPRGALDKDVAHVVMVEVPEIRRVVLGLKDGEMFRPAKVCAPSFSSLEREEK